MRISPGARVLLLLVLGVLACGHASAQGGAAQGTGASHAWLLLPDDDGGAFLAHAPPRRAWEEEGAASAPGTIRAARSLATSPIGLAAVGDRVYLLMPPGQHARARVLTLWARRPLVGDFWVYTPQDRLDSVAPLPDTFEAESIAGGAHGPVVLGREEGRWTLCQHVDLGGWHRLSVPDLGERPVLLPGRDEPVRVLVRGAESPGLLIELDPALGVSERAIELPSTPGPVLASWAGKARVLVAVRSGDAVELVSLGEGEPERIASVSDVPERVSASFSLAGEELLLAWRDDGGDSKGAQVIELSTSTGREFYRGPADRGLPIGPGQFKRLAVVLVVMSLVVLGLALAPSRAVPLLPEGVALAEPSRRFVATMTDLLIAAFVASVIFGIPLLDLLSLRVLFLPGGGWTPLLMTLLFGGVAGTLGEAVSGRTIGKLLAGCRVCRPDAGGVARRPGLWRSAVRNLLKWGVPPVSALALVDPSGISRCDAIAGLLVVTDAASQAGGGSLPD